MPKLKYIAAGALLFMVSFVGGCCGMDMHLQTADANEPKRMVCVENAGGNMTIWKDKVTGVHYLFYREYDEGGNQYGNGIGIAAAMCVLVDEEGKPLVDKE